MHRSDKERVVSQLAERLRSTETLMVADYRGLTMPEIEELRTRLLEAGARFLIEGSLVGDDAIKQLATLPPTDVLRAQLVGAVSAPLATVVGLFTAPLRDLVGVLDARIKQLQEQEPEAEAAAEVEEPQAEAPAEEPSEEQPEEPSAEAEEAAPEAESEEEEASGDED